MANCNGCLKDEVEGFCSTCQTKLFDRSDVTPQLTFNWDNIVDRQEGEPGRFSISGMQAKGFIGRDRNKLLAPNRDIESTYIIKPFVTGRRMDHKKQSPANEHLTMVMANKIFGIETALCAVVYFADGEPAYLTRRFDRDPKGNILNKQDFEGVMDINISATNDGSSKYTSCTYEKIGKILIPSDQIKFLKQLIYNFLTSNGDAHLKNFGYIEAGGAMILSPGYDLMNTRLHVRDRMPAMNLFEEMERTATLNRIYQYKIADFLELGERIGIKRVLPKIESEFRESKEIMVEFVKKALLSRRAKATYIQHIRENHNDLFR